jgi:hypothetical protein
LFVGGTQRRGKPADGAIDGTSTHIVLFHGEQSTFDESPGSADDTVQTFRHTFAVASMRSLSARASFSTTPKLFRFPKARFVQHKNRRCSKGCRGHGRGWKSSLIARVQGIVAGEQGPMLVNHCRNLGKTLWGMGDGPQSTESTSISHFCAVEEPPSQDYSSSAEHSDA